MDYIQIEDLPLDIINIIVDMLVTKDKIYFMATNIYFLKNVCIFNMFCNVKISQNIIEQRKFRNLNTLTIYNNKCLNVSKLTKLTYLNSNSRTDPIEGVSCLTNLTELHASYMGQSKITQNDIINLSLLTGLNISFNTNITSITHLTKLLYLHVSGNNSNIYQSDIKNLTNLTYLNIGNNRHITNLSHLPNLVYLRCLGININISKLYKLSTLELLLPLPNINISHLTNITELEASKEYICNNKITINNLSSLTSINIFK